MSDATRRRGKNRQPTALTLAAERAFRDRLAELGAELLEPAWLGSKAKHHARCLAGHDCYPCPESLRRGNGPCITCAGMDPAVVAAAFRARLAELGATLLEPVRPGAMTKHHVRCSAGHDCYPCPHTVRRGHGICRRCAGLDSATAEAAFRARVAELGGTVLESAWLGSDRPHRVRCAAGHECAPKPNKVCNNGRGLCRTCARRDPVAAEAAFRARLGESGAIPLYDGWCGTNLPHHVRCRWGHDCFPRPGHVQQGHGICRVCKGQVWDVFYVVTSSAEVKFGITSGDPVVRLRAHARNGFTNVIRVAEALPGGEALDTERAVKAALASAAERPTRGREYFGISCLALVLDIADSWLGPAWPTSISTSPDSTWIQDALFAA